MDAKRKAVDSRGEVFRVGWMQDAIRLIRRKTPPKIKVNVLNALAAFQLPSTSTSPGYL